MRDRGLALSRIAVADYGVVPESNPSAPDNEGNVRAPHELQPGPQEGAGWDVTPVPTVSGKKPRYPTEVGMPGAVDENGPEA